LERAKETGEKIYVDSSYVGKPLYLKLGFREVGGFVVADSGVRVSCMLWEPSGNPWAHVCRERLTMKCYSITHVEGRECYVLDICSYMYTSYSCLRHRTFSFRSLWNCIIRPILGTKFTNRTGNDILGFSSLSVLSCQSPLSRLCSGSVLKLRLHKIHRRPSQLLHGLQSGFWRPSLN